MNTEGKRSVCSLGNGNESCTEIASQTRKLMREIDTVYTVEDLTKRVKRGKERETKECECQKGGGGLGER